MKLYALLAAVLSVMMIISGAAVMVGGSSSAFQLTEAPAVAESGTDGACNWTLNIAGTLTLSDGNAGTFSATSRPSWDVYRDSIFDVVIGSGVTLVPSYGFSIGTADSGYAIKTVSCSNSVTSVGNYAFAYCYDLVSFSGSTVGSLGLNCFSYCPLLKSVYVPSSAVNSTGVFNYCNLDILTVGNLVSGFSSSNYYSVNTFVVGGYCHSGSNSVLFFINNWCLPGQLSMFPLSSIVIDYTGVDVSNISTASLGKSVIFTDRGTGSTGGTFYASDGVTELIGDDRAGHTFTAQLVGDSFSWVAASAGDDLGTGDDAIVDDGTGYLPEPGPVKPDLSAYQGWFILLSIVILLIIAYAVFGIDKKHRGR